MGMPITVEISGVSDIDASPMINKVFDYFTHIDILYSPFKESSQVGKFNRGELISSEMKKILDLAEKTKKETEGFFNIKKPDGLIDPSGIVKGWAIKNAAKILKEKYKKYYVDAGGDAEIVGKWMWGIRNPFNTKEIVKVLDLEDCGIATSGTYERGQHIYNPITKKSEITDILSLTVIGPNVYEADRFATGAFAMGKSGIRFIESLSGFEGYMIASDGIATMTSGFEKYVKK